MAATQPDTNAVLAELVAEQKLVREHLAALTSELRAKKRKAIKRVRTNTKRVAARVKLATHKPTELDVARARRLLAKCK